MYRHLELYFIEKLIVGQHLTYEKYNKVLLTSTYEILTSMDSIITCILGGLAGDSYWLETTTGWRRQLAGDHYLEMTGWR